MDGNKTDRPFLRNFHTEGGEREGEVENPP